MAPHGDTTVQTAITLSEQQEAAALAMQEWFNSFPDVPRKFFTLQGYAGTGKTFTINEIVRRLHVRASYMAYTGKAALVMRKYAHVPAKTIHSTIYTYVKPEKEEFEELYKKRDETEDLGKKEAITKQIKELMQPRFELNDSAFEENGTELIVLDECSMVDEKLLDDLLSFKLPIIALGDPGQLPPVAGTGALFTGVPNSVLTEVRRQSLDNPIIAWSMLTRAERTIPYTDLGTWREDKAAKVPRNFLSPPEFWEMVQDHDVTICWKNKTRQNMNQWIRQRMGFYEKDGQYPIAGEKIIFTRNDRANGLFNGLIADVVERLDEYDNTIEYKVKTEEGKEQVVKLMKYVFQEYTNPQAKEALRPWDFEGNQEADFGYVLTCHKAQGSQWERVLVIDENVLNWPKARPERAKWLYTAITRAADKVTIVTGS